MQHSHDTFDQDFQKSFLPSERWGWDKNQEILPQTLLPQWIFHPFIFMSHVTSLTKKLTTATHLTLPTLPLRVCLHSKSLQSCLTLQPHGRSPARLLCSWDSLGKNIGVGCHALLQGIFPTQGSNLCLLHCRQILYGWAPRGAQRVYYSLINTHRGFLPSCPISELFLWQNKNLLSGNIWCAHFFDPHISMSSPRNRLNLFFCY